jgi:hypothetical protein
MGAHEQQQSIGMDNISALITYLHNQTGMDKFFSRIVDVSERRNKDL